MTSFLNRLLSTTLGDSGSGSAHVSLRPRFALTTAAPALARPRDEPIEDNATARSELPRSGTPPHASRRRRGTASRESPKETHPVESEPTLAAAPLISSPAAHSASRKNAPDPEIAPHQHISGPLTWSAHDFLVAPSRASASSPFDAPAAMRTAVTPVLPVLQVLRLDSRATPLSDAVVAGRTNAPRDDGPVIHVTIDRIEVRAPAADQAGTLARRPRPQPTISLSEYLRRDTPGGRR